MFVCDSNKKIEPYRLKMYQLGQKKFLEKPEILAPANVDTYKYAIYNGANAIYFGVNEFNARAKGNNFTTIKEVVEFCHIYGVKAYLALNIIFKNSELARVKEIIIEAEEAKIDAFIITDLALVKIIKKYSKAQMHASTQMGVHSVDGVKLLEKFGFDRVILSREVNKEDIEKIIKETDLDVEIFVHGALCIGFSGACLMSSMLTCDSGNRGKCHQLCRKSYTAYYDNKLLGTGYFLSAKDINMLPKISELNKSNIKSYKIEGRLKRPEYVAGVTKIYKKYVDKHFDKVNENDNNTLKKLFNRGNYCTGYFDNNNTIYPFVGSSIGIKLGFVKKVIDSHRAVFSTQKKVNIDDGFKILRNGIEVCGAKIIEVIDKNTAIAYTNKQVKINDKIAITTDTQLNKELLLKEKKIKVDMDITLIAGEKAHIIAHSCGITVDCYDDEIIMEANTIPLDENSVITQFSRTKNTVFEINFTNIKTKNSFIKKSKLNSLRNDILNKVYCKILENYKRNISTKKIKDFNITPEKIVGDFVEINSKSKNCTLIKNNIKNVVYSPHYLSLEKAEKFYKAIKTKHNKVFIKPPIFVHEKNQKELKEIMSIFDGVVANNLGYVNWAIENNKILIGGYNLNIINTKNPLIKLCNQYFVSVEANKREIQNFKGAILYTYGYLPLMYLNCCPKKLTGVVCGDCDKPFYLVDEGGEYLVFSQHLGNSCNHIVKNGIITSLGNEQKDNVKYFDFVDMKTQQIEKTLFEYYIVKEFSIQGYNHLHLSRGV